MKQIITILSFFLCLSVNAQKKATITPKPVKVEKVDSFKIKVDSLLTRIEKYMQANDERQERKDSLYPNNRFKMYPTENIYNLLELDTQTGRIWQVQWNLDGGYEGSSVINDNELNYGTSYSSGSYELYPTKNMYQFILLDKTDGRTWHVQWGHKKTERWIRRIY